MVTSMITCSSIADCLPVHSNRVSYGIAVIKHRDLNYYFFVCNDYMVLFCFHVEDILQEMYMCVLKQVSDLCLRGRRAQHSSRNSAGQGPWWRWDHIQNYSRQWGGQLCHRQPERWDIMFQISFLCSWSLWRPILRYLNIH